MKDIRVAVINANLGNYDPVVEYPEQKLPHYVHLVTYRLDDETFPPRPKAMTSRLQAGMPKMLGWQFFPGYDYYIWIDTSCIFADENSVMWFLDKIIGYDFAFFKHPDRDTIYDEYFFVKRKMQEGSKYLCSRYQDEWLEAQWNIIAEDLKYEDNVLYASTAFIYKNTKKVQNVLKEWWYHKTRFLLHDQLALPYVTRNCKVNVIPDNYLKCPALIYTRNKKR